MRILVVVPALNEQVAVPQLVAELIHTTAELGLDAEVLVVDDGSTDHTAELAQAAGARVVRLCRNLGIGAAVQSGLRVALREGFDCAIQCDGDGQHPPAELAKLIASQRTSPPPDLVIGSRYSHDAGFRSTTLRRFGSRWLALCLRLVTGVHVTDPTSGYRLYGRRALRLFDQIYPYDYPEPEAVAIASAAGLRVVELPVTMRERQGGRSSIAGLGPVWYMVKVTVAVVLSFFRNRRRRARPGIDADKASAVQSVGDGS